MRWHWHEQDWTRWVGRLESEGGGGGAVEIYASALDLAMVRLA